MKARYYVMRAFGTNPWKVERRANIVRWRGRSSFTMSSTTYFPSQEAADAWAAKQNEKLRQAGQLFEPEAA